MKVEYEKLISSNIALVSEELYVELRKTLPYGTIIGAYPVFHTSKGDVTIYYATSLGESTFEHKLTYMETGEVIIEFLTNEYTSMSEWMEISVERLKISFRFSDKHKKMILGIVNLKLQGMSSEWLRLFKEKAEAEIDRIRPQTSIRNFAKVTVELYSTLRRLLYNYSDRRDEAIKELDAILLSIRTGPTNHTGYMRDTLNKMRHLYKELEERLC